jgi:hypothetical protein
MDKVSICHACGRTMESAFNFCPWCGTVAATGDLLPGEVDAVFEHIDKIQTNHTCSRITRMENELGELEKALSLLLAGESSL